MAKKKSPYNQNAAIRSAVRRMFSRSPLVWEVLREVRREVPKYNKDGKKAKKPAVQYLCAVCKKWYGSTKVAVDHIIPVIDPLVGFVDWNTFIDRLFCEKSNLQVICDGCHQKKTNQERLIKTIKQDTESLIALAERIERGFKSKEREELKKEVAKLTSKTKPEEIRKMALMLKERLK